MMRRLPMAIGLAAAMVAARPAAPAMADGTTFVSGTAEQDRIDSLVRNDPAFAAESRGKKVVFSTAVTYKRKAEGSPVEQDYARTLHYRYDDGRTLRTIFNLNTEKVEKVDVLENYPTPPGPSELAAALKIAHQKSAKLIALRETVTEDHLKVAALASSVSDRADPQFGKRLITLYFRDDRDRKKPTRERKQFVLVTVNLSDGVVSPP